MTYLGEWLTAFEAMRRTNKARVYAYIARLTHEKWVTECSARAGVEATVRANATGYADTRGTLLARSVTVRSTARVFALGRLANMARLIHSCWMQRRLLETSFATHRDRHTGVVALTSTRLPLTDSPSPRARLRALSRALPGASCPDRIGDAIDACQPLLVFEPHMVSSLWNNHQNCRAEQVFVIDYVFVGMLLACSPLRSLLDLWKHWRGQSSSQHPRPRPHAGQMVAAILLSIVYQRLLDRAGCSRAFIFAGNSFATEALRAGLIHAPTCTDIWEVLHGIPTPELEEYLVQLFRSAPSGGKHCFVPTLRALPLYGIYTASENIEPDFAVNTALNKYLLARPTRGAALLEWFYQEYRRTFGSVSGGLPLIVTIMGANSHEKKYVESEPFAIEQVIIRYIEAALKQMGRPFALCYTPHPIPSWSSFAHLPMFNTHKIILYPDTTFTWLVADLCIALHSSALFEAAFAGARVFTPMRIDDSIYPATLLNRLNHPGPRENYLEALGRFLRENSSPSDDDPRVRISRRAARLWNLNLADPQSSAAASGH